MSDEAEVIDCNPMTSFHPEIRQASDMVIARCEHWADRLTSLTKQLQNSRTQAIALADEHINLGRTIAGENFANYKLSGPSLGNTIVFTNDELIEKLLRDRLEVLQVQIAKHLKIFDDWTEVMAMFEKHFRADVDERYGEGGAKHLS